ncbi:hypothetical protein GALMADRAFT_1126818 [Galerina marginata CBS 339.88]|uniref:Uncharacterized protein n=1 Tax=Galerina marginata (strain CBS 339.88) TaxID=685588 RepID=A0A067S8U9_GALM3|nr:hypothetical protein GALMADRAFT_1126818 [Galerina marginata CBS 339.88]
MSEFFVHLSVCFRPGLSVFQNANVNIGTTSPVCCAYTALLVLLCQLRFIQRSGSWAVSQSFSLVMWVRTDSRFRILLAIIFFALQSPSTVPHLFLRLALLSLFPF